MKVWMIREGGISGRLLDIVTSDEICDREYVVKCWEKDRGFYYGKIFPPCAVICLHVEEEKDAPIPRSR